MPDLNDMNLLREYVRQGSEAAFAEVVRRQVNLVYSAAFRQVGNAAQAEEIVQAVFVILAQKAGKLRPDTILEAWLYETTRLTSLSFLRGERRRQQREQEAYMQSTLQESTDVSVWNQLAPQLDEAMARLGKKDREAVVLRFFKEKPLGEVATALQVSEAAAQSRVHRAVEKLRRILLKRGVVLATTAITGAVAAHSVQAAPAGLAHAVSTIALTQGAVTSGSTLTLAKGALKLMAWTKIKTTVMIGVAVLLAAGTATVVVEDSIFLPREPSYQGKSLLEWLAEVDYDQPQDQRTKAADAIHHMGADALPFLLNDLDDSPKSSRRRVHYLKPDLRSIDRRYSQASWGFDALGALGKPAIPRLVQMLEQNPGYVPEALAGIGREALPELLKALTNRDFFVRDNTAAALGNAIYAGKIKPEEAAAAVPIAINNLTYMDTNLVFLGNTRFRAADLIGALGLQPELSVPALVAGLEDPHGNVAVECAQALGRFEAEGKAAVPALAKASASTKAELRCTCLESLSRIDPQAFDQDLFARTLELTTNASSGIQMRAVQIFGRLGSRADEAVPALIQRLTDPNENEVVRMVAAQSLGAIRQRAPEVVPALRQGLLDSNRLVRVGAANALEKFGQRVDVK